MKTTATRPEDTLTPCELEACSLLIEGLTNRQIGKELGRAEHTVTQTLSRAMKKTGRENRVMLALWFVEKYPTESSRTEGYRDACVRVIQSRTRAAMASVKRRALGK